MHKYGHDIYIYIHYISIHLVSRIVGAYLIKPFNEGDFVQKV